MTLSELRAAVLRKLQSIPHFPDTERAEWIARVPIMPKSELSDFYALLSDEEKRGQEVLADLLTNDTTGKKEKLYGDMQHIQMEALHDIESVDHAADEKELESLLKELEQ